MERWEDIVECSPLGVRGLVLLGDEKVGFWGNVDVGVEW